MIKMEFILLEACLPAFSFVDIYIIIDIIIDIIIENTIVVHANYLQLVLVKYYQTMFNKICLERNRLVSNTVTVQ